MNTAKFEIGKTYEMRYITDANLKVPFIILKRTNKTVTVKDIPTNQTVTKKVYTDSDGFEYTFPVGKYSMAPVLEAKKEL